MCCSKLLEEGCHLGLFDLHLVLECAVHVTHLLLEKGLAFGELLVEVRHILFCLIIVAGDCLLDGGDVRLDFVDIRLDELCYFLMECCHNFMFKVCDSRDCGLGVAHFHAVVGCCAGVVVVACFAFLGNIILWCDVLCCLPCHLSV